jgi:TolB-like protein/class 3 adenylate cyclase/cytochrome c-type biogenesis protein CcmH/NrfG
LPDGERCGHNLKPDYSCSTVEIGSEKIRSLTVKPAGGDVSRTQEPHLHLEVGHILFLDIVGYSKLLSDEQKELVQALNQIVRETEQFRAAEAEGKLTRLPTGDGMVLVFTNNPEAPVECALEISQALQSRPKLRVRMGIHSGPVNPVADVNDQSNLLGAGINVAQRVMYCGDAGHILLSKHFAEDLAEYAHWRPHLHDVGGVRDKHGLRVPLVNLYTDQLGTPALPAKLRRARATFRVKSIAVAALLLITALGVAFWMLRRSQEKFANATAVIPFKSIAVLPFENLSADPENAFFTDGVQDEILNNLAKIADLKVISRTSVMQYKGGAKRNLRQIANELGVAHVVEGNVQRAANRVRVSTQLIDAKTDTHLWANSYDRPLGDVFAIQSEIAKAVAAQLQAKLSPAEKAAIEEPPTTNFIAYDRYLRAQKLRAVPTARVPGDMRETIRLLDQAIAYDPTFLRAYGALASAHAYVYHLGVDHTPGRIALAKQARDTALRLGPDRPEAHLAAALVAYHCYRDYETALSEVAIARSGLPNDGSVFSLPAYIARRQGRWEQCARGLERAVGLDPRNVWLLNDTAQTYQMQRRFSEAAIAWDRVLAVAPNDPTMRVARTLLDLEARADTQPAHEVIQRIVTEDPSAVDAIAEYWLYVALCRRDATETATALASLPPEGIIPWNVRMPHSFFEGLAARVRNDVPGAERAFSAARVETEKIAREQPDYAQALCVLGMIDAALGHKEDAIREGRRAVELLPVTKDALAGAAVLTNLAITYAWAGEKDLAIKQLEELVRIPSPACYGQLKLHPFWDPLRGDPRFEQLVEEAKKPVALK